MDGFVRQPPLATQTKNPIRCPAIGHRSTTNLGEAFCQDTFRFGAGANRSPLNQPHRPDLRKETTQAADATQSKHKTNRATGEKLKRPTQTFRAPKQK